MQDHSRTLAELLATVGTLPSPMELARSIDPASLVNDAGACVLAVPGRFVELTSGHEALRLFAHVLMDWPAMQMILTFKAQSMIEQDMHALTVKVQAIGPAVFVGLSGWNIPKLTALETTSHSLRLVVAGSGAVVLQPAVTHKVALGSMRGVERLEVHTAPLRVPITLQLKSPRIHLPADIFFQRFHTWHFSCTVSGALLPTPCCSAPHGRCASARLALPHSPLPLHVAAARMRGSSSVVHRCRFTSPLPHAQRALPACMAARVLSTAAAVHVAAAAVHSARVPVLS